MPPLRTCQRGEAALAVILILATLGGLTLATLQPSRNLAVDRLAELWRGRNPAVSIGMTSPTPDLVIEQDRMVIEVSISTPGYLTLIAAGSDGRSFKVIYPNAQEGGSHLSPGTHSFPRSGWTLVPTGPAGAGAVLAMLTSLPLDPAKLQGDLDADRPVPNQPYGGALLHYRERSAP